MRPQTNPSPKEPTDHLRGVVSLFLRLALAAAFLSAVADRFGFWGAPGADGVAWGEFSRFLAYTGLINPWAPEAIVPALGWIATVGEVVIGSALLLGFRTRSAAIASGVLLLLFGVGMTWGTGIKSALDASVFSASAAAFSLAILGAGPLSVDRALGIGEGEINGRDAS
ncbi:MAG: DoxX protein [Gemmatimonadota bacterium]